MINWLKCRNKQWDEEKIHKMFSNIHISTSVGGEIQSLAWDPTGERLAVLLKGLFFSLLFHLDEHNHFSNTFNPGF